MLLHQATVPYARAALLISWEEEGQITRGRDQMVLPPLNKTLLLDLVTSADSGIYTVTVTVGGACTATAIVDLGIYAIPTVSDAGPDQILL